jgi:hypothetical protein
MSGLVKHIKKGKVYRRADLEFFSTSIDRELATLTSNNYLIKVSQGLYYAPLKSKYFLIISPNIYNTLGLGLTQLYNVTWVYNHKRKGRIELGGDVFEFKIKSSFPKKLTKEYLLIDLLNNLYLIAESQDDVLKKISEKITEFDQQKLRKLALRYGSGLCKALIKSFIKKTN